MRTASRPGSWTRRFLRRVFAVVGVSMAACIGAFAQTQFYTLSTAEGLSDNYINTMTVDRNGYLWVGTGSGLNRFNGKQVERFFAHDQTALRSDIFRQVSCDSANRIWVINDRYELTIIDVDRQFRPVVLADSTGPVRTRWVKHTSAGGTVLLTDRGLLRLAPGRLLPAADTLRLPLFDKYTIAWPDSLYGAAFYQVADAGPDILVVGSARHIAWIDLLTGTTVGPLPCMDCRAVGSLTDRDIAVYDAPSRTLQAIDPRTGVKTNLLADALDQAGLPLGGFINRIVRVDEDDAVITTRGNGAYVYRQRENRLTHYAYAAGDPAAPANPNPSVIAVHPSGWIFLGCMPHGVSYFNHDAVVGQRMLFRDGAGMSYDREIVNLATHDNDTYYLIIGSGDLLVWQRSTNTSRFVRTAEKTDANGLPHYNSFVLTDDRGRPWVSAFGEGLVILDPASLKVVRRIDLSLGKPEYRYKNHVRYMCQGPDGQIWICSSNGLSRVSPETFAVDHFSGTPFDSIRTFITNHVAWPEPDRIWVATETRGVFVMDREGNTRRRLSRQTGDLLSNPTYCINNDRLGNVYVGTDKGLHIFLADGRRLTYTEANGLLNSRLEVLLLDDKNRMWFGNDVGIGCFNIADTTLRMFDERFGLSVQGFRVYAYHQNSDGELVWGTERGIQYFYPDSLYDQRIDLLANIHRIEARDLDQWITGAGAFTLPAGNDFVTFHFSTLDFSKHIRTFYQYKLEGLDPDWITVMDQQTARYNSMKPGTYTFRVRASHDGKTWHDAAYPVRITLLPHFFQTPWFRWLVAAAFLVSAYAVYLAVSRRVRRRALELEAEATIQSFASTINRHKDAEEMFRDVVRLAIARLGLDACVIYLLDANRHLLVRKSAAGPSPGADPGPGMPEIPFGQGIAGQVAMTGEPLVIQDADKEPRLLPETGRKGSAIAVPIVLEGQVVGVIDGTVTRRKATTHRLLRMLTTIAVLMAAQIRRNEAEDAKRRADLEVLQNKRQAAESRLQSLRLQMNPHFLFNALNSIQQMILANEELVATRYLSRFSKLLRSILVQSDKETVTLREELDMLRLYIELESVRFKDAFAFTIDCDDEIDPDEVKIPTLLLQPFVENAIWHGLMHKEGDRHLRVAFTEEGDMIRCIIEDNGIGRKKASELKQISGQDKKHTSKGITVARERLNALQKNGRPAGHITFTDLTDAGGNALGTRVDILFPPQR